MIGLAVVIDNLSEALSIGELVRAEGGERQGCRILGWTSLIGVSLFASAMAGWLFLRGIPEETMGAILGAGAGGMFYLTVGSLLPESEEAQYQQSGALAVAAGFLLMFVLSGMDVSI